MTIPPELYTRTAADYDRTLGAVGVEIILGCLAAAGGGRGLQLHRQTVVDAGCGTGNYAHALRTHVGAVHAVDRDAAMLAQARAKTGDGDGIIFHNVGIDSLPLYDRTADGITVNQVLHHLGGEDAIAAMVARHVDVPRLREFLAAAGFTHRTVIAPVDAVLQGDAYFDPHGPANAEWRSGDSIWSLLSATETAAVETRIANLARDNAQEEFMQGADAKRENCGQISFAFSVKG